MSEQEHVNARFYAAVVDDHALPNDCGSTCDIAAALRAGYPRVAGYLLSHAAEAPFVAAVARSVGESFNNFGHASATDPDWLAWRQWFAKNTLQCELCKSFNFTDSGPIETCGDCAHVVWSLATHTFTRSYAEAAIRSSGDRFGKPFARSYDLRSLAPETVQRMRADCDRFRKLAGDTIRPFAEQDVARDFWLTRNGIGTGFKSSDYPERDRGYLTWLSVSFLEFYLSPGDDGLLHGWGGVEDHIRQEFGDTGQEGGAAQRPSGPGSGPPRPNPPPNAGRRGARR